MWWVPLTATTSGRCRVESRMAPATGGAAATAPPPPRRRPGGCGDCAGSRGVLRSPAGSRGRRDAAQGRARCLGGRATGAGARAVRGARRGRRVELRPAAPNEEHIFVCKAGDRREGERLWAAPRGPRCAAPRGRRPRQRARITIASRAASRRAARASLRAARSALPALRIAPPERAAPRPSPPSPAPLSSSPLPCSARARRRPAITSGERGTR